MNFVQGEGEKGQLRMTRETTKTLAQGRKGRDGRPIVLDRQPAQVFAPVSCQVSLKISATMFPFDALRWRSVRIHYDIPAINRKTTSPSPLFQADERLDHILLSLLERKGPGEVYQGKSCKSLLGYI